MPTSGNEPLRPQEDDFTLMADRSPCASSISRCNSKTFPQTRYGQYCEEHDVNFMWGVRFSPNTLQLVDRLAFALGVLLVWGTSYWLAADKGSFHLLYAGLSVVVLLLRFVEYSASGRFLYYLDLCYVANIMFIAFCAVPAWRSPALYRCLFAWICGPTTWQMIVIKNELVFHSWDRMVSMFIHWYPAVAVWVVRWYSTCEFWNSCDASGSQSESWSRANFMNLTAYALAWYMLWMGLWCLVVFGLAASLIEHYKLRTVYHWMMMQKEHPFTKVALKLPPRVRPLLYLSAHFIACCYAICVSYLLWHSFALHTSFLVAASLLCLWNGTGFFFGVFPENYREVTGLASRVMNAWAEKKA